MLQRRIKKCVICKQVFKPEDKIYWREYYDKHGVKKRFMHYECYRKEYENEELIKEDDSGKHIDSK